MDSLQNPIRHTFEFALHTRSIHFSLIITSVGLLAAALFGHSTDVERAYQQITDIQQVIEIWEENWLYGAATEQANEFSSRLPGSLPSWSRDPILVRSVRGNIGRYRLSGPPWTLRSTRDIPLLAPSIRPLVVHPDAISEPVSLWPPRALSDFRQFWNYLYNNRTIYIGGRLVERLCIVSVNASGERNILVLPWEAVVNADVSAEHAFSVFYVSLEAWFDTDALVKCREESAPLLIDYGLMAAVTTPEGESVRIAIPVNSPRQLPVNWQMLFSDRYNLSWRQGSFEYAFRELHEITDSFQDVAVAVAVGIVRSERARSGQQIEVFGARIPMRGLAAVGVIILLGIQSYLGVHIKELCVRIDAKDPAWQVAWLVLYRGRLPHALNVISISALPVVASIALVRPWLRSDAGSLFVLSLFAVGMLITLSVVSLVFYSKLRRMRSGGNWRE